MAQVVFSGATGTITNLNANFSQLYDWREYVTTPGYTGATPKLTLSATFGWTFAVPSSGDTLAAYSLTGANSIIAGIPSGGTNNPRLFVTHTEATGKTTIKFSGSTGYNGSIAVGNTDAMTFGAGGNVAIPAPSGGTTLTVTPVANGIGLDAGSTTNSAVSLFPVQMAIGSAAGEYGTVGYNWRVTGGVPVYLTTDFASRLKFQAGGFQFQTAPSGTAGNAITLTTAVAISQAGNFSVSAPSSGITAAISGIANGTIATVGDGTRTVAIGTDTANGTAYIGTSTAHPTDLWQGGSAKVRLQTTGNLESIANGLIGYGAGSGGTVTQATSKSTGVTLNKASGQITMNAAALGATTSVNFTLTNSTIGANDVVNVAIKSGATAGSYLVQVDATAAGSCSICLRNYSGGSLSEAVVLNFAVLKASVS